MRSIFKNLNDKDWLVQKYLVDGLSAAQISKNLGAKSSNSVRQSLIFHGIPIRGRRAAQIHDRKDDGLKINEYTQQIIEGCLLGDGCLYSFNPSGESAPRFRKRNKFQDHIEFVRKELGLKKERAQERTEQFNALPYSIFEIKTLSHDSLRHIYNCWYPEENSRRKIVPKNFKLTSASLLHWFMDDGCSQRRKNGKVFIIMCSESFTKEENIYLVEQLKSLGIKSSITPVKFGTGWRIRIPQSQSALFFQIIGEPKVKSLAYKWKFSLD